MCTACHHAARPAAELNPAAAAAAETEIRRALDDWLDAYGRQDQAGMARVWAPDVVGWYPGQPAWTYADVEKALNRPPSNDPTRPSIRLSIEEIMVSGDQAVVRDIWRFTRRFSSDSVLSLKVYGFEVWRQQPDGRWRIARWISAPESWLPLQRDSSEGATAR